MCMHLVLPERLPAESHLLSAGTEQAMSTKHRTTYPMKPLLSRRRELAAVNLSPRASVQLRLCTAPAARQQVPPHRRHQYHSALLNLRPQMQSQRPRNRSRSGVVRGGDALPVRQLMLELVLLLETWSTDTSTSSAGKERGAVRRVPAPLLAVVAPSAGGCLARPRRG